MLSRNKLLKDFQIQRFVWQPSSMITSKRMSCIAATTSCEITGNPSSSVLVTPTTCMSHSVSMLNQYNQSVKSCKFNFQWTTMNSSCQPTISQRRKTCKIWKPTPRPTHSYLLDIGVQNDGLHMSISGKGWTRWINVNAIDKGRCIKEFTSQLP